MSHSFASLFFAHLFLAISLSLRLSRLDVRGSFCFVRDIFDTVLMCSQNDKLTQNSNSKSSVSLCFLFYNVLVYFFHGIQLISIVDNYQRTFETAPLLTVKNEIYQINGNIFSGNFAKANENSANDVV